MTPQGVVALTGGTGFVGKVTIDRLIEAGWIVRALARKQQPDRHNVIWVAGSLDDTESLSRLCAGADAILHIAGSVNAPDAAGFEAANVTGTDNMIVAAKDAGIRRFVYISSLSAREPQLSNYGASKAKAEKRVGASMLDWTIIRPPGIYGPGDAELLDMFKLAQKGWAVLPPKGRSSWIHVDDLARLLVAILPAHEDATARIFEADDGEPNGWDHAGFGRALGWAMGKRVIAVSMPKPVLFAAAYADRRLRGNKAKLTPDRAGYMSHRDWTISANLRPPAALWQPLIRTRKGLADTARWYRAQGWIS
jgi:nucleoside-diphosphate-sugar epimerase